MNRKNKIKLWDNEICSKHVINLVNNIHHILRNNNIETISYVDVGANVGKVYDLLSEKININYAWMFEASPILFDYLSEKYIDNTKVLLHNAAVNNENGEIFFDETSLIYQLDGDSDDLNLGLSKIQQTTMSTKVASLKLSDFFSKNYEIFDVVSFIKIDTETVDFNILKDLLTVINQFKNKPIIEFEVNYMNLGLSFNDAQEILNSFEIFGYKNLRLENCHGDGVLIPNNINL